MPPSANVWQDACSTDSTGSLQCPNYSHAPGRLLVEFETSFWYDSYSVLFILPDRTLPVVLLSIFVYECILPSSETKLVTPHMHAAL